MRRLSFAVMALALVAVQAGCTREQPVTTKAPGYGEKVGAAEVIFLDDPKFHEAMRSRTSGSITGNRVEAAASLERDIADFGRRVAAELPPKVKASGIQGSVTVLTPDNAKSALPARNKAMLIYPVSWRTQCTPCYSVLTYRVEIVEPGQKKPSWGTDARVVVSRSDSVDALWDSTVEALRSDKLLPEAR